MDSHRSWYGVGWREDPDGNKISLTLATNSGAKVREAIGSLFTQEAVDVGIDINLVDFNTIVGQNVYPSGGNRHMIDPGQSSPRRDWEKLVDAAWVEANNTTNEDQRKSGYQKIQQVWIEEVPWVYTFNAAVMIAVKEEFGNIYPQPGRGVIGISYRVYVR